VLDSLSEACEAISDDDAAQRYKAEADRLAALFYGPAPDDGTAADAEPASPPRPAAAPPRGDPGSQRRFPGAQTGRSPSPGAAAAAVDATALRRGVASMMSRLGLAGAAPGVSDDDDAAAAAEDSSSIRQAERHLRETVAGTGDADVIAMSMSSPPAANSYAESSDLASGRVSTQP